MIKIKALMVNHENETFAELSHAQALDFIFSAEWIDNFGDFSNVILDLGSNKIELYRNTGLVGFEDYVERVDELSKIYKNVTNEMTVVE